MAFNFSGQNKFGFSGTQTTAANPGFSLGGGAATTTSGSLFGGFGTGTGTGTSTFGGTTALANPFGGTSSGFGTATGTSTGSIFGGTGSLTIGAQNQAQQQQQQQQHNAAANLANMASAVSLPLIFGDERDVILAKWNQLQAFWGAGKGFYDQQGNAVQFTPDNPFCRFKAVGYSCRPKTSNEDGLVGIVFNQAVDSVRQKQQQAVDALHRILGSKPTLAVCVEGLKGLPNNKTEMIVYIQERSATGATSRISASDLFSFMMQPGTKQQLQQLGVEDVRLKTGFTPEQLKLYLDNPPKGVDPLVWQQAKLDNPDPDKLLPVPMVGFKELYQRLQHQESQTDRYHKRLQMIAHEIANLQRDHSNMVSKAEQYKRKQLELSHRVLQVMVKQEIYRKLGYAIQADEEQLRVQLEAIQTQLNAPTQFKGRLNELMSQLRMQNQLGGGRPEAAYQVDAPVQQEIRQHLRQQQEGVHQLIGILRDDLDDLKLIEQGLAETTPRR